ncbi:hypothetical protein A8990_107166 [Paenibacillus taihuensis]|uniref:RNA polymerase sigma factor 70 region 4 type 2 domain-containing protein n=1 Tax=Paenibacillus taihuensis TaxID=1156355 RepID=A0A3D9SCL7_9BACL|nr:DUF4912 domain-containing protein [Paenibacillus taihuensis]REE89068.1 hypothetical protein A8990_107166 [Paenibacillus taihuensis]
MEEIIRLRNEGLSQREIAARLGITSSKVRYHLAKHGLLPQGSRNNGSGRVEEAAGFPDVDFAYLPESVTLDEDRLVLLPKDPKTLYVYWKLTERRIRMIEQHFHCAWHELPKWLRVYDVSYITFNGDNANRTWDIQVGNEADNWFMRDMSAGTAYCVDFGTTSLDGRFITLLRSNAVETPRLNDERHTVDKGSVWASAEPVKQPEWAAAFTGYSITE